jgi:hypothetical protein
LCAKALIAGPADIERIGEGFELAGRVQHQGHLVPDLFRDMQDVRRLLAGVAIVPAMDLEGAIAEVVTLLGEGGEGFLAIETAISVAVIGAGIGRQTLAIATKQNADGTVELLARPVPKRDIKGAMAKVVELADFTLQIVIDPLALLGVPADQLGCQHLGLGQRRGRGDPVGDIFAATAILGLDAHGVFEKARGFALGIPHGADGIRAGEVTEILGVKAEFVNFHTGDLGHFPSPYS